MYARVMLEPEEERARTYVDMLYWFSVFASLHSLTYASCSASVGMVVNVRSVPCTIDTLVRNGMAATSCLHTAAGLVIVVCSDDS